MEIFKKLVPIIVKNKIKRIIEERRKKYIYKLPKLSINEFSDILINNLKINSNKYIFIHSSINNLNLGFESYKVLPLIMEITGKETTLLFPSYPKLSSYKFLLNNNIFDLRKTPSYTGILTEFARRTKPSLRSLHPTKSVCAIGPAAEELTNQHHLSIYPYSKFSPYRKLIEMKGRIIGIGVRSTYYSCVHCVDDEMETEFPVQVYHNRIFDAKCIDYSGNIQSVRTLAHDMNKMSFNLPRYFARHIPAELCQDIELDGMNFFTADAKPTFDLMLNLAKTKNITIYPKRMYKISKWFAG